MSAQVRCEPSRGRNRFLLVRLQAQNSVLSSAFWGREPFSGFRRIGHDFLFKLQPSMLFLSKLGDQSPRRRRLFHSRSAGRYDDFLTAARLPQYQSGYSHARSTPYCQSSPPGNTEGIVPAARLQHRRLRQPGGSSETERHRRSLPA